MPAGSVPDGTSLAGPDAPLLFDDFDDFIVDARADLLVFQHWIWVGGAAKFDVPIALDLHGPLMIETAFQRRADTDMVEMVRRKLDAFRRADFISCAGEHQRRYFLPWLQLAGRDVTTETVAVIPVSFPPDAPKHAGPSEAATFVYGGTFLPWQDPTLGLQTLVGVLEEEGTGHLDFFGAPHPRFEMDIGVFTELEASLQASDRVTIHGMRPRDEVLEHYRHCHVALDLMRRNNERDLAFTTRTAEYLWCGLPVIYGDYGELASLIREYEAGWIVSPEDGDALAGVLRGILRDSDDVKRRSANAQRLARERLNWEHTIDPLDRFCRRSTPRTMPIAPVLVADPRQLAATRAELAATQAQLEAERAEIAAIRSTKTFRALAPIRRAYARLRRPFRR
jgi:glycosyltransferase involved in cell wall biosynthesis